MTGPQLRHNRRGPRPRAAVKKFDNLNLGYLWGILLFRRQNYIHAYVFKLISVFIILMAPAVSFADTRELTLASGRRTLIEIESVSPDRPWIVFLPGSGCSPTHQNRFIDFLREEHSFNVLIVNKAGLGFDNECRALEFEIGAIRKNRIADAHSAMDTIFNRDARVLLIGESEGGYIAPEIARDRPQVKALLLLSAGTRSWIEEELAKVRPNLRAVTRAFLDREVLRRPTLEARFNGWTYAQLKSYHTSETFNALKALEIPVLAFNGEKDEYVPIAGTVEDFKTLIELGRTNIRSHLLRDSNHGLECVGDGCARSTNENLVCEELLSLKASADFSVR